jgi:tRNA(fMet)-specific endonuclease VapC
MSRRLLVDSNHLSKVLRPHSKLRGRFEDLRRSGVRFGTCLPVICEVECVYRSPEWEPDFRRMLRRFLNHCSIWPLDLTTTRLYGEVFRELRRKGRALSQVDMMQAALARQMNLTILTADGDFSALPDLRIENWLG